jgi:quercetin dioxygenase-like cupin family protein
MQDFASFEQESQARGYGEVLERVWQANEEVATHTHPFAVRALVVEGEFWLTCNGRTQHLLPGQRFELDAEVPHAERYGPQGAVFWAARKYPPAA